MVKSINGTTKSTIHLENSTSTSESGKLPNQQTVSKTKLPVAKKIQKSVDTGKLFLESRQRRAEQRYQAIKAEHRNIPDNLEILPYEMQREIVSALVNGCTPTQLVKTLHNLVTACPTLAPLADELGAKYIEDRAIPISNLGFTSIKSMVSFATKLGPNLKYFNIFDGDPLISGENKKEYLEDSDIQRLVEACPNLETINLHLHYSTPSKLSNNSLEAVAKLKNLKKLTTICFKGNNFTDTGLSHLSRSPSLEELDIGNSPHITDRGLIFLTQRPTLKSFSFANNAIITTLGLSCLSTLPHLESLIILSCELERQDPPFSFGEFTKLKYLGVYNCDLDNDDVKQISSISGLESLNIGENPRITINAMSYISELTHLKKLHSRGTKLQSRDFSEENAILNFLKTGDKLNDKGRSFSDFGFRTTRSAVAFAKRLGPNLENFHISYYSIGEISDQDIEELVANCPNLKFILIKNRNLLSNNSLRLLSSLQHLKALYIWENNMITNIGLRELRLSKTLAEFAISSELISDEGLSYLSQIPELEKLIVYSGRVTDIGISYLKALEKLVRLNITGCSQVTRSSVKSIAKMKLKELNCEGTGLAGDILLSLSFSRTGGTVKGLADYGFDRRSGIEFAKSIGLNLKILDLDGLLNVSDADIEELVEACPNIQEINITHSNMITDRSMEKLATLKHLEIVNVASCPHITNV